VTPALVGALLFAALSLILLRANWRSPRPRRNRGSLLPPPEERPDYRNLAADIRVCPECRQSYATRSVVRAEASCNACVERRFAASVEADKREWIDKGWKEKG